MNLNASPCFMAEVDSYARLPGMEDKALRRFADRVVGQLLQNYDRYCEVFLAANDGDNSLLLSNGVQAVFYGRIARMTRAFNITPMHLQRQAGRVFGCRHFCAAPWRRSYPRNLNNRMAYCPQGR
ncbi:hypothetical protein I0Y76_20315 [Serratia ureilytica]|nr:hypothetical protein [Serratia ureilytica]